MGTVTVITNYVDAKQERVWVRVEEDGERLAPEPVALYLEDKNKRMLLCVVIEAANSEDDKEGAGSYAITFFPYYFLPDFNCTNSQLKVIV